MSLILDEHRQYLSDGIRLAAFEAAVSAVVKPGHVVLDLAAGTGIMGLFACRAGARTVYSIEMGGVISVAREVARANRLDDRIVFINDHSYHVRLPEKVDVVVADQIGNFGFNAGIIEYFADARRRFLKPEGVTIPLGMMLAVAPVEAADLFEQVEFWNGSPGAFDFRCARLLAANTGYQVDLSGESICGDAVAIANIDLNSAKTDPFQGQATSVIRRSGTMHGIGGWFTAQLANGISMTNSPLVSDRIQRRQVFFPIDNATQVLEGDLVKIRMAVRPADSIVNWNVDVLDEASGAPKRTFRHSTWKGMLITSEELKRTQPAFKPKLNPWGQARRTVVNLCDGARSLAQIEDEVLRRHPDLFQNRKEVMTFVAEVVTRYGE